MLGIGCKLVISSNSSCHNALILYTSALLFVFGNLLSLIFCLHVSSLGVILQICVSFAISSTFSLHTLTTLCIGEKRLLNAPYQQLLAISSISDNTGTEGKSTPS